jgi:AcrR family transcriptional regulator
VISSIQSAREEILRSAVALFARKGYAGTGVQEILDAVGLSKPTLYYHFENKAGLFRAILDYAYDESFRLMKSAVADGDSTEEKLVAAAAALFEFAQTNPDLMRLVFSTTFAAPEEVPPGTINIQKRQRNLQFMADLMGEGQERAEISADYDVTTLALGIFGTLSNHIRSYLLAKGFGELDSEQARKIVSLFMNGARAIRLPLRENKKPTAPFRR